MKQLRLDLGYAIRSLARSPGFTLIVVLILALGLGANTTIFIMVSWLVLRPLPVAAPNQLVFLAFPQGGDNLDPQFSRAELQRISDDMQAVASHVAGMIFGGAPGAQSGLMLGPAGRTRHPSGL